MNLVGVEGLLVGEVEQKREIESAGLQREIWARLERCDGGYVFGEATGGLDEGRAALRRQVGRKAKEGDVPNHRRHSIS